MNIMATVEHNVFLHDGFLVGGVLFLGWMVYAGLRVAGKRLAVLRSHPVEFSILRRFSLPIGLLVVMIFADDIVMLSGYAGEWWSDELIALFRSAPVFAWTWALIFLCRDYFNIIITLRRKETGAVQAMTLMSNTITMLLIIGAAFVILKIWSVNLTPLLASAGLLTAIWALASKDAISNFFGSIAISLDRPFYLGDYIVLDTGERGEVVNIGIRSTRIRTRDDVLITIPNAKLSEAKIVNETRDAPRFRIRCKIGVAYDSDPDQVEEILLESLKENPFILHEPKPRVRFRSFGESAIELELLGWINEPENRGAAVDFMIRHALKAMRGAGIEIPFPQRVVVVKGNRDQGEDQRVSEVEAEKSASASS